MISVLRSPAVEPLRVFLPHDVEAVGNGGVLEETHRTTGPFTEALKCISDYFQRPERATPGELTAWSGAVFDAMVVPCQTVNHVFVFKQEKLQ